jgi:putative membrane protein
MLWIKALHIIFVTSWFAGLFYLPRLFVNHAMVTDAATSERLKLMEQKLYRFMLPLALLALGFGIWLWLGYGVTGHWMDAKLTLVAALVGYHFYCGKLLNDFKQDKNQRGHIWYRWFNELPVIVLSIIVILVVVKPF